MTKHSDAPDWDYQTTKEMLFTIDDYLIRSFVVFAYVLGGRMNEIMPIRPKDIEWRTMPDKTNRIIGHIVNLKNPHRTSKSIPLNPINEKEYSEQMLSFKESFSEESMPFQQFSSRYYQLKIRTLLDIHPHALRHLRVHHVDDNTVPGMTALTPRQFQDFFGWSKISTSSHYQSRTRSMDLAEKM